MAALERPERTPDGRRDPSFFPAEVEVRLIGPLLEPVSFALLLRGNGLSLKQAHAALETLTRDGIVRVSLAPKDLASLIAAIEALSLGVEMVGAGGRQA